MHVVEANGEDLDSLYSAMCDVVSTPGPAAVVTKRPMAPKIKGLEGTPHAHDAVKKSVLTIKHIYEADFCHLVLCIHSYYLNSSFVALTNSADSAIRLS
jgi:hypothetical protein